MVKNHLKRIAAPKSWRIERKTTKYVTRPSAGPHQFKQSMPLSLALRELIKFAKSAKDAKMLIKTKDVFVDKRKRVEEKYPVGLMDIIEFPQIEEHYRILLDRKGKLTSVKANNKEANLKICKIISKTKLSGGKTQLHTHDSRNIIVDKDTYKNGDSLQLTLPEQKIIEHIKLEKGAIVLLISGKYAGMIAKIEEISANKIIITDAKNQKTETTKQSAFAIATDKITLDSVKQLADKK